MSQWFIACGDGVELARLLPDRSMGLVLTDPPYRSQTHEGQRSHGADESNIDFDPMDPEVFLPELMRVASRWVIFFCEVEQLGLIEHMVGRRDRGGWYYRGGLWVAPDRAPQFNGKGPAQGADGIAILHRPDYALRWNGRGRRGVWTCGVVRRNRKHPTQKPVQLLTELIREFSDPGDIVFDPFAGVASVGAASLRSSRRYIGCELDPGYHATALSRLESAAASSGAEMADSVDGIHTTGQLTHPVLAAQSPRAIFGAVGGTSHPAGASISDVLDVGAPSLVGGAPFISGGSNGPEGETEA